MAIFPKCPKLDSPYSYAFACLALLPLLQCSGPYLKNRLRDAGDVATFELQQKSYGASLHISALNIGLSYRPQDAQAMGLRAGQTGKYTSAGFSALFFGADYFTPVPLDFDAWKPPLSEEEKRAILLAQMARENAKKKKNTQILSKKKPNKSKALDLSIEKELSRRLQKIKEKDKKRKQRQLVAQDSLLTKRKKAYQVRLPLGTMRPAYLYNHLLKPKKSQKDKVQFAPAWFYTRLEMQIGLGYGLRLGLNPGELVDFLIGWTTLDLYDDDAPYEDSPEERLKKDPRFQKLPPIMQKRLLEELQKSGSTNLPLGFTGE